MSESKNIRIRYDLSILDPYEQEECNIAPSFFPKVIDTHITMPLCNVTQKFRINGAFFILLKLMKASNYAHFIKMGIVKKNRNFISEMKKEKEKENVQFIFNMHFFQFLFSSFI